MRLHIAHAEDAVGALDAAWDDLVRVQERPNATLLGGWLNALIGGDHDSLLTLRVRDAEDRLLAATVVNIYRPVGRIGSPLARWPGDPNLWFDPDILVLPGHESAGDMLLDGLLGEVGALHVSCLQDGPLDAALRRHDERNIHRWIGADGWISPIPVPRDAYARVRVGRDVRAAERKGARITTTVATSPSEVADALERLFALHYEYWSTRPDAILRFSSDSSYRELHRRAVTALATTGEAFITEVRENYEVVASSLALRAGVGLVKHTSATTRRATLREPGYACTLATIDHAASLGVTHVDLGPGAGGPNSPKHRIGANRVVVFRTLTSRSRTRLLLYRALLAGRDHVRQGVRLLRRRHDT